MTRKPSRWPPEPHRTSRQPTAAATRSVALKCGGCGARQDVYSKREVAVFENGHGTCPGDISLDGPLQDFQNLPESSAIS